MRDIDWPALHGAAVGAAAKAYGAEEVLWNPATT